MPEFWEVTHTRAQQTNAVWNQHNPAFTVGTLTLADHQANTALLFQQAGDVITQQDAVDDAVTAREQNTQLIHDLNIRAPQVIKANFAGDNAILTEVQDVFNINPTSQAKELKRARRLISLWTRANAARAAMTPILPDIDIGGSTVTDLQTAVDAHPPLLQAIEDRRADLNEAKSTLRATDDLVDRGNKDWYVAWSNYYAEGTAEHDALTQIETESGGSAPTALEIESAMPVGSDVLVTYVAGGGAHATTLELLWQVVGEDADFDNMVAVILPAQSVGTFTPGQTVRFKTQAENSQGTVESAVTEITIV